jgi:hypothetical protein
MCWQCGTAKRKRRRKRRVKDKMCQAKQRSRRDAPPPPPRPEELSRALSEPMVGYVCVRVCVCVMVMVMDVLCCHSRSPIEMSPDVWGLLRPHEQDVADALLCLRECHRVLAMAQVDTCFLSLNARKEAVAAGKSKSEVKAVVTAAESAQALYEFNVAALEELAERLQVCTRRQGVAIAYRCCHDIIVLRRIWWISPLWTPLRCLI